MVILSSGNNVFGGRGGDKQSSSQHQPRRDGKKSLLLRTKRRGFVQNWETFKKCGFIVNHNINTVEKERHPKGQIIHDHYHAGKLVMRFSHGEKK
jgi:hypothetical protein